MTDAMFGWLVIQQQSCLEEDVAPCSVLARGRRVLSLALCATNSPTGSASTHLSAHQAGFSWHSRYGLLEQLHKIMLKGTRLLRLWKGLGVWFFSKYIRRGRFSTLLAFHNAVALAAPKRLLHAAHGWRGRAVSVHISRILGFYKSCFPMLIF